MHPTYSVFLAPWAPLSPLNMGAIAAAGGPLQRQMAPAVGETVSAADSVANGEGASG